MALCMAGPGCTFNKKRVKFHVLSNNTKKCAFDQLMVIMNQLTIEANKIALSLMQNFFLPNTDRMI